MRLAPIVSILMTCLALNAQTIQGKVVRVSDGDTITILDEGKVENKIRLNRIDAPEKKQAFGEVFVGDVNVNLRMVQGGMAWHFKRFDNTKEYALAESEARARKIGLWRDANPIPPWEFRKQKKEVR